MRWLYVHLSISVALTSQQALEQLVDSSMISINFNLFTCVSCRPSAGGGGAGSCRRRRWRRSDGSVRSPGPAAAQHWGETPPTCGWHTETTWGSLTRLIMASNSFSTPTGAGRAAQEVGRRHGRQSQHQGLPEGSLRLRPCVLLHPCTISWPAEGTTQGQTLTHTHTYTMYYHT